MSATVAGTDQEASGVPSAARLRAMYAGASRALSTNRPLRATVEPVLAPRAALARGELAALEAAGLTLTPFAAGEGDDPLARTIVDYMALVETSLTAAAVARMLKVDASRIRQRLREGSLYGFEHEGEWRLPRFQFERQKVLPGLAEVLAAAPADANPLEIVEWFLWPNPELERGESGPPWSPRQWLLRGLPAARLAALVRHL